MALQKIAFSYFSLFWEEIMRNHFMALEKNFIMFSLFVEERGDDSFHCFAKMANAFMFFFILPGN